MRLKIGRRRLAHAIPKVAVRDQTPWPLRWALIALLFGFFGALGMWAFERGSSAAGIADAGATEEVRRLRSEIEDLKEERDKAQSIANTADSLLKTEKAAQEKLAQQVRELEAENLSLQGDLGFFERLLPSDGSARELAVRGLQAQQDGGELRFQLLVMQAGRSRPDFKGGYELSVSGTLEGKPWTATMPGGARTLHFKQYQRVEGSFAVPASAMVKSVQVRVVDASGRTKATETVPL